MAPSRSKRSPTIDSMIEEDNLSRSKTTMHLTTSTRGTEITEKAIPCPDRISETDLDAGTDSDSAISGDNDGDDHDESTNIVCWKKRRCMIAILFFVFAAIAGGFGAAFMLGLFGDLFGDLFGGSDSDGNDIFIVAPTMPPVNSTPKPTELPSLEPSTVASSLPSSGPTQSHSDSPTSVPSTSSPTKTPSPTKSPSTSPTMTAQPTSGSIDAFSFYVMGDIPYTKRDEVIFATQMEDLKFGSKANAVFTVHVGDLQMVSRSLCQELFYETTAAYLMQGPLPTLVVAGDNDWIECPNQEQGFELFLKHFNKFEDNWSSTSQIDVVRNVEDDRPELFQFMHNDVLFLSNNVLQEAHVRMDRNVEWFTKHIEQAFDNAVLSGFPVRAVIMFGHGIRSPDNRFLFEAMEQSMQSTSFRKRIPVLYIHGDGHQWKVDRLLTDQLGWESYWDIMVDNGGQSPPILIDVAPIVNKKMIPLEKENQWQSLYGNGLIRIDRQGGPY